MRGRDAKALGGSGELAALGHRNEFIQAFPAIHGVFRSFLELAASGYYPCMAIMFCHNADYYP
ncbi:hypothetical protein D3C72_2151950 [compost metagenome]